MKLKIKHRIYVGQSFSTVLETDDVKTVIEYSVYSTYCLYLELLQSGVPESCAARILPVGYTKDTLIILGNHLKSL